MDEVQHPVCGCAIIIHQAPAVRVWPPVLSHGKQGRGEYCPTRIFVHLCSPPVE